MSIFHYQKDSNNIVTITMDMDGSVNAMNSQYREAMGETVNRLEAEPALTGVIITSAKKVFLAGGDLHEILATEKGDEQSFLNISLTIKDHLRRLEKLPVPVVAAINGAALGGGLELCLACNHRIAYDHKSVQLGLPEVSLGLLPGAGGIVRFVNLIGLKASLPYLMEGKKFTPAQGITNGIIHQLCDSIDALIPAAKSYILEHRNDINSSTQPWDRKGHKIPGGNADTPANNQLISLAAPALFKKTQGLMPAPEQILDVAVQAARIGFDAALMAESRALTYLVVTPQAKNMINTFFFQMNQINGGASRPKGIEKNTIKKLGILGAGMMGQGIAYSAASVGIQVILKDVSLAGAEKGKAYSDKILSKSVEKGRISEAQKAQTLDLITATDQDGDLDNCDLIIEAVFENMDLKHSITKACEPMLASDGVWASNTSTLPISMLASASNNAENFIGMHFFSPVDRMPLVEIICGEKTSDATLAKAFDFTRQIKKTPIVVNDSPGFFTSRVIMTYLDEGIRLLKEGLQPERIDNLGRAIGMPIGPLAIHDETSQQLTRNIFEAWDNLGLQSPIGDTSITTEVICNLIDNHNRGGRHHGGGFYEYPSDAGKTIWPPLLELYYNPDLDTPDADIKDRLLFRPVIEALTCLQNNVLRSSADGNIGSIMGIGAPTWTGGYLQFVNTYGLEKFITRCDELSEKYGERLKAPQIVKDYLASGKAL